MMDYNTVDFFDRQDWISKNHKEYISKVIKFSTNIYLLSKTRMNLCKIVLQLPVFDVPRFHKHFYQKFWEMRKKFNTQK